MDLSCPQINLLIAWLWMVLGFASGLALGLFFHREDWLGGYGSLKRRLYRLAHISMFGLGVVNLCFYLTSKTFPTPSISLAVASWAMVIGAISMPCCCLIMAHFPKARLLFALPVLSLLLGGLITLLLVASPGSVRDANHFHSAAPSLFPSPREERAGAEASVAPTWLRHLGGARNEPNLSLPSTTTSSIQP